MHTFNLKVRSFVNFAKRLGRDVRGEDEANQSLNISRMGKVAIVAVCVSATAVGATAMANSANKGAENTAGNINKVTGAGVEHVAPVTSPFGAK